MILLNSTAAAEVDDQAEGIELGPGALATWLQEVNITGGGCPATAQVVRSAYHNGTWADDNDESTYTDISDSVSAAFTATRTIVYHSFIPDAGINMQTTSNLFSMPTKLHFLGSSYWHGGFRL